jgi:lipoprotein-anchoring transpeptidase ErfK/SrfK
MKESPPDSGGPAADRRKMSRASTWRKAIVSVLAGQGSILQGTALDLSPDGMRVAAPVALPKGATVEVTLPTRPGHEEAPLSVTGRVMWTAPGKDGAHEMGISLDEEQPPTEAITSRAGAEELIARVREELRERAAGGPEAIVGLSPAPRATARPAWRRLRAIIFVLTGMALFLWFFGGLRCAGSSPTTSTGCTPFSFGAVPRNPTMSTEEQAQQEALHQGQAGLMRGNPRAAKAAFEFNLRPGAPPAVMLIAALGHADALRMEGRTQEAIAAIAKALDAAHGAPKEWRALAQKYRDDLMHAGIEATAPPLLMDALELLRPGDAAATTAAPSNVEPPAPPTAPDDAPASPPAPPTPPAETTNAPARIEVDKSDYVLTLYRGATAIATYPVGLGNYDSTPKGDFVIANKLLNPDWFNRGEAVKAGDPRNPLGKHWMGLGDGKGPTSYGIHETRESASIGANLSRGCVRMRPEDATALYAACALGTPVRIVD